MEVHSGSQWNDVRMCEAHVNDAVRKACPVKKVSSSRSKNQTVILSETELDTEVLMTPFAARGMRSERSRKSRIKKEDYSVEFIGGSGQKRGVNMNTAMQSFGYGLAALLFASLFLACAIISKSARKVLKSQQTHKDELP